MTESVEEIAYGMLQKNHYCKIEQLFEIAVLQVDDKMLISPNHLDQEPRGNSPAITIRAAKAKTGIRSEKIRP